MKNWLPLILSAVVLIFAQSCKQRVKVSQDNNSDLFGGQSDIKLIIHLRGIDHCTVSLCPMSGTRALSSVRMIEDLRDGGVDTMIISRYYLPGEFVLSFSKTQGSDNLAIRHEKYLIVSEQDLELWINPFFGDDPDSTRFQEGETENNAYRQFDIGNSDKREALLRLYDSLLRDTDRDSKSWRHRIRDYEKARGLYNNYINKQIRANRTLFASQIMEFNKLPEKGFCENTGKMEFSAVRSYLDEIDFRNPLIIKVAGISRWMDDLMEFIEDKYKGDALYDTIVVAAGTASIEKVRDENPFIYGWMTDYFYDLFSRNNNFDGLVKLQSFLDDPGCLTSYKLMTQRRQAASENVKPGNPAPDFHFINSEGKHFMLHDYETSSRFKMLLFWNTGCMSCIAVTRQIHSWYKETSPEKRPAVFAVNLDENFDVDEWRKKVGAMPEWEHMIDRGGIDSEGANAYCILATPVVFIIDSQSRKIVALPVTIEEIAAISELL